MAIYYKVKLPIIEISSEYVRFDNGGTGGRIETFIYRKYKKTIVWKLHKDGLYVHEEFVKQYNLTT